MRHLLVVEDNVTFARSLQRGLAPSFEVEHAATLDEAKSKVDGEVDVALVDLFLSSDGEGSPDGLDFVRWLRRHWPEIPAIVVTGFDRPGLERRALRLGAQDFVLKGGSLDLQELRTRLEAVIERHSTLAVSRPLPEPPILAGSSTAVQSLRQGLRRAGADPAARVLIRGEAGTRKDLVARELASSGPLADAPFYEFDCFSLRFHTLQETMEAGEAVVLLYEVGRLNASAQAQLAGLLIAALDRASDAGSLPPCQVLATTSASLDQAVSGGMFRADLLATLSLVELRVASLRERKEDIGALADAFCQGSGKQRRCGVDKGALRALQQHSWPGNIREFWALLETARTRMLSNGKTMIDADCVVSLLSGLASAAIQSLEQIHGIHERLAWHELNEVSRALRASGGGKERACALLQYGSRQTMRRRLNLIRSKYPQVWQAFPDIMASYGDADDE